METGQQLIPTIQKFTIPNFNPPLCPALDIRHVQLCGSRKYPSPTHGWSLEMLAGFGI